MTGKSSAQRLCRIIGAGPRTQKQFSHAVNNSWPQRPKTARLNIVHFHPEYETPSSRPLATHGASYLIVRSFSRCMKSYETSVTLNPRQDDDGRDMLVEITSRASKVRSVPCSSG